MLRLGPVEILIETLVSSVVTGVREAAGSSPEPRKHGSRTLLPERFRRLSHQSPQLDLAQRPDLLQPAKALLHKPSPAQADGISGLARGPAIQVAAAALVILRNMRRHVQLPHCSDEILRVVSLVCAHGDAA